MLGNSPARLRDVNDHCDLLIFRYELGQPMGTTDQAARFLKPKSTRSGRTADSKRRMFRVSLPLGLSAFPLIRFAQETPRGLPPSLI